MEHGDCSGKMVLERTDNVSAKIDCWDEREESGVPTMIAPGGGGGGGGERAGVLINLETIQDLGWNHTER